MILPIPERGTNSMRSSVGIDRIVFVRSLL